MVLDGVIIGIYTIHILGMGMVLLIKEVLQMTQAKFSWNFVLTLSLCDNTLIDIVFDKLSSTL